MIISFGAKKNSIRYKSWMAVSLLLLSAFITLVSATIPTQTANAQSVDNFEPGIQKALYKNALATCIGYSALRDDKSVFDTRSNINESNAASYKWFSDSPTVAPKTTTTLDVFAGVGISQFGGSGVDAYGRALCSNPAFIASAVQALGYTAPSGDANTVFKVLCDFGFRRSGGDGCLSGSGSWSLNNGGDAARDTFFNSAKAKAIPNLTDAQLYWLGYNSFVNLCNATITPPGGANVSQGTVKIKTYDQEKVAMVDSTAAWGPNPKSISVSGTPNDLYTVGILDRNSTNFAPNVLSAGQVLQSSVRVGNQINGCVDFANWVNRYADAYKNWRIENPSFVGTPSVGGGCNADAAGCDSPTTCIIEGVGWIVCPVMNFTAGIVDAAYGFVTSLLKVQPVMTTGETKGIYDAWVVMRNIANIAFVIAFLLIIFSQLTSLGVSNYGVKKILPRLVVTAVLVNVSFWICAIGVDASNIAGASMREIFTAVGASIAQEGATSAGFNIGGAEGWKGLVSGVLAGSIAAGAIYYVGLSALIPALIAALVAILTVFVVLTLRQGLIVLLIVIAPIAFVAYLLPNTESWFTKWRKLLTTLLLMYPIIAAIFGASALASQIIMATAQGNIVIMIMAACIAIIPLAITPLVMKTAGGVLNRFAGIVNNAERGPIDRLKKVGEGYRNTRVALRDQAALKGGFQGGRGAFVKWRSRRGAIATGAKSERGRAEQQYIADAMTKSDGTTASQFAKQVAGGTSLLGVPVTSPDAASLQRALAGAKFTIERAELEEVKAAHSEIDTMGKESLGSIIMDSSGKQSPAKIAAAIERYVKIADTGEIAAVADTHATSGKPTLISKVLANSLAQDGSQALKAPDIDNIARGMMPVTLDPETKTAKGSFKEIIRNNTSSSVWSQEKMVGGSNDDLNYSFESADDNGKRVMRERAIELLNNETLRGKIKHNEATIYKIAGIEKPTAAQTQPNSSQTQSSNGSGQTPQSPPTQAPANSASPSAPTGQSNPGPRRTNRPQGPPDGSQGFTYVPHDNNRPPNNPPTQP